MKPRYTTITDPDDIAALIRLGKYREDRPFFVRPGTALLVLVNDAFAKWRESREGKRL
jgi:hypothetical protein